MVWIGTVALLVGGSVLIWTGFTDPQFYQKAPGSSSRGDRLPVWFGRLISFAVGGGLMSNATWRITNHALENSAMRVLFPLAFLAAGIVLLWMAATGKTFYYPRLGVRDGNHRSMPPREGRFAAITLALFFLFIAVWAAFHQR